MILFEVAKGFESSGINLPSRSTANSVGYDIECAEDVVIPPFKPGMKPTLVKTGVKAFFPTNIGLFLYNRSSNPGKKSLILSNGVGVVESDYYNNPENDGHIMFAFYNNSNEDQYIKKHDRIGQGVFMPFYLTSDDQAEGARTGGFGSTGD